jgi:tetratricopeptide (TPR) repeat protein
VILINDDELDVLQFEAACRDTGTARHAAQWLQASAAAAQALELWRGTPLLDVDSQVLRDRFVLRLEQMRVQVIEDRAEAELRLGHYDRLVPDLRELTAEYPLRENFHAQLMEALARGGRQAEALQAYQRARRVLVDELGIEPGPQLQRLHQQVLRGDPALIKEPAIVADSGPKTSPTATRGAFPFMVPRQLPGTVAQFTGRWRELAQLSRHLDDAGRQAPGTVVISAIGGTAGVGKTALAVRWAHQVADRFPDGQLYVNLRGYDPDQMVTPADALTGFLRALGVPGSDIPPDLEGRAARYRSLLAGRRVLVVLDNARSAEQVRLLLPATPACMTVVTSRDSLAGLVAREGAVPLSLDLLPETDAIRLLGALIGERAQTDPGAIMQLAGQCSRLPLALRIAAELAITRPAAGLTDLVEELADQQRGLELLNAGGDPRTGIRAVFSWSYRYLAADEARLFRLLGLHPGTDVDLYAAAALAGTTAEETQRALNVLARAHLIQGAGFPGPSRFFQHDLLRAFARELAHDDRDEERHVALTRLFDYYLHGAAAAMNMLFPAERHRRPEVGPPGNALPPLADRGTARAWLDRELANLAAAAAAAAAQGWPGHATQLSRALFRYLGNGGHLPEAAAIHTHAVAAARLLGDREAEAAALSSLSQIDLHYGRSHQATSQLQRALMLLSGTGDRASQARVLHNLATVEFQEGRYQQAGEHHRQALELHRAAGNQAGAARALGGLSDVDLRLGRFQEAGANLQQALSLCREVGDRVNEAYIVALLGDLSLRLSRYQDATAQFEHALVLFRETGDQTGEAWTLAHLGAAHLEQGHGALAVDYHQHARAIACDTQDLFGEAEALNGLGETSQAIGQAAEARVAHARALSLTSQTGDKYEQARAHAGLACGYEHDEPDQAADHWRQALALYDELGTPEAGQIRARRAAAHADSARAALASTAGHKRSVMVNSSGHGPNESSG